MKPNEEEEPSEYETPRTPDKRENPAPPKYQALQFGENGNTPDGHAFYSTVIAE